MTLGEKIRDARKNMGLSQEQLAEKLCVSRQAITKWESDKGMPDISNMKLLAQLLGVSVDYLLDDGTPAECSAIKEAIDWDNYPKSRWNAPREDAVVLDKYPDAVSVSELMRRKKRTKSDTIADELLFWFTDIPTDRASVLYDQFNDTSKYYLVELADRTMLVNVTKEYIISRRLTQRFVDRKLEIGSNIFIKTARKIKH